MVDKPIMYFYNKEDIIQKKHENGDRQMQKKIAAVHDISGFGRCSLTTAIAVLSAAGHQCCPVPSAVLSAHTAYPGITFRDLTDDLPAYVQSFASLGLKFDAVYSGYLSSARQIEQVRFLMEHCAAQPCIKLVDPVMGDNGVPYRVVNQPGFAEAMRELCTHADLITPNTTECAMLLGQAPSDRPESREEVCAVMERLALLGAREIVVTGLHEGERVGAACFSAETGETAFTFCEEVPAHFPGTGDLFASVLLAHRLNGAPPADSCVAAAEFVRDCAAHTAKQGGDPRDGVLFEQLLFKLMIKNN